METPNNSKPPTSPEEFRDLTETLVALQLGLKYDAVPGSLLGSLLKSQNRKPFSDGEKLKGYLRRAQAHGIVTLCEVKGKETTILLAPATKVVEADPNKEKENGTSRKPMGDISVLGPLIKVLMDLHRSTGASSFRIGKIGSSIHTETKLFYAGTLRQYLNNAQTAGLIEVKGEGSETMISLALTLTPPDKPSTAGPSSPSPPSSVRAYATLALPSLAVLGSAVSCLARRAPTIRTFSIHPRMARYQALK